MLTKEFCYRSALLHKMKKKKCTQKIINNKKKKSMESWCILSHFKHIKWRITTLFQSYNHNYSLHKLFNYIFHKHQFTAEIFLSYFYEVQTVDLSTIK